LFLEKFARAWILGWQRTEDDGQRMTDAGRVIKMGAHRIGMRLACVFLWEMDFGKCVQSLERFTSDLRFKSPGKHGGPILVKMKWGCFMSALAAKWMRAVILICGGGRSIFEDIGLINLDKLVDDISGIRWGLWMGEHWH
jgi:hypothetical protein